MQTICYQYMYRISIDGIYLLKFRCCAVSVSQGMDYCISYNNIHIVPSYVIYILGILIPQPFCVHENVVIIINYMYIVEIRQLHDDPISVARLSTPVVVLKHWVHDPSEQQKKLNYHFSGWLQFCVCAFRYGTIYSRYRMVKYNTVLSTIRRRILSEFC